jgi:hypothetical protein
MVQAEIVASNIQNMLDNKPLYDYTIDPAGIHLTLGIVSLWSSSQLELRS